MSDLQLRVRTENAVPAQMSIPPGDDEQWIPENGPGSKSSPAERKRIYEKLTRIPLHEGGTSRHRDTARTLTGYSHGPGIRPRSICGVLLVLRICLHLAVVCTAALAIMNRLRRSDVSALWDICATRMRMPTRGLNVSDGALHLPRRILRRIRLDASS